jgi:ATP-dependent DNA helicase RecG
MFVKPWDMVRFWIRGTDKAEFIDNKQVNGNIFKLIKEAMAFSNTYLPVASTFSQKSIERIDTPLFPILALREAIANAICHRDYSYQGGRVSFAIFDDRIEVWSYGLFTPGVSIENLTGLNQSVFMFARRNGDVITATRSWLTC